ncbi:MAG TPA: ribosome maturation factor RimP [Bacillota bacterium]|nr:ribosome maturation factor RimP [Bacillota bacterium]
MAKKKVVDLVTETLEPFLGKEGYCLYNTEFIKEGKDWFLRVFIEKAPERPGEWPGDVNTDDCEKVSRFLSEELDRLDPVEKNYYLEVSSPGMDRPLFKEEHFERYKGRSVDVRLFESIGGKKSFTGKLSEVSDRSIRLEDEKREVIELPREKISKINLTIVF